jgi:hypothetical protein
LAAPKVENLARILGMADKLPLLRKNTKLPENVRGPHLRTQEFYPLNPASLARPVAVRSPGSAPPAWALSSPFFPAGRRRPCWRRSSGWR